MAGDGTYEDMARALLEQYDDPRTALRRPMPEPSGPFPTIDKLPPKQVIERDHSRAAPPRVQQEVAENISPTMGAYGATNLIAGMLADYSSGNTTAFADKLPLALGIFAGVKAKTANLPALERAQAMAAKGAPREAIWNDTGWFQGRDGQWRWEINDRGAAVPTMAGMGPAGTMLPHPQFSAAYPQLDKLHTVIDTTDSTLGGNFGRHPVYGDTIVVGAPSMTAARKLGLHERQHATQKEEGFQRGANPESFKSDPGTIAKIITGRLDDMLPEKSVFADYLITAAQLEVPGFKGSTLGELKQHVHAMQLLGRYNVDGIAKKLSDTIAHNRYRRTAGEVEARNVERRANMSDEQRRAKPPWETQDIPDVDQILRQYGEPTAP